MPTPAQGQFYNRNTEFDIQSRKSGPVARIDCQKINLDERLDARIDKALKRLAQLKTFKQLLEDQTSRAKTIDHRGASKQ